MTTFSNYWFPAWRLGLNDGDVGSRLRERRQGDALEWGLWDLDLPAPAKFRMRSALLRGRNLFQCGEIPRRRPVRGIRAIPLAGDGGWTRVLLVVVANHVPFNTLEELQGALARLFADEMRRHGDPVPLPKISLSIPALDAPLLKALADALPEDTRRIVAYEGDVPHAISLAGGEPLPARQEGGLSAGDFKKLITNAGDLYLAMADMESPIPLPPRREPDRHVVSPASLLRLDHARADLPLLEASRLEDPGLWDVWWPEGVEPDPTWYVPLRLEHPCAGADPWEAVDEARNLVVALDFGTSATVAAVAPAGNSRDVRLLRIGGLEAAARARDYENPTALEFLDAEHMLKPWRNEPWRPGIAWKDVRCSHQARHEIADNPRRARCGLRDIKTWARARSAHPLRLRDEKGAPIEFAPLPVVKDAPGDIGDFSARALDPVELYAFFLGIFLNNQTTGRLHTRWCMTFPVEFDAETRARIRQGFARGLLRSLPASLTASPRWKRELPFRLDVLENEPSAVAAALLPRLGVRPTPEGEAFGIFDFGGGTADFAFGRWRTPTQKEKEENGWRRVLDILDVAGDADLGGEHLLELMAFHVIRGSMGAALEAGVAFRCPPQLTNGRPAGSEMLFDAGRAAHANLSAVCEAIRPLWEEDAQITGDTGFLTLDLETASGGMATLQLAADEDELRGILRDRINEGVEKFFTAFGQAFRNERLPQRAHIIPAGNACRSPLTRELFAKMRARIGEFLPGMAPENVLFHDEMLPGGSLADADAEDLSVPTLKTCVAIGLLRVLPDMGTGVTRRGASGGDAEAPFALTAGLFNDDEDEDLLVPVLRRNAPYGQWTKLGKVRRNGVMTVGWSDSPLAAEGGMRRTDRDCGVFQEEWGPENFGAMAFIRAVGPRRIALALGPDGNPAHVREDDVRIRNL